MVPFIGDSGEPVDLVPLQWSAAWLPHQSRAAAGGTVLSPRHSVGMHVSLVFCLINKYFCSSENCYATG